jgi:hypothetical protein
MFDLKIFHKKNIGFIQCPGCGKQYTIVRYKADTFKSKLLNATGFKECHCKECKWDGKIFSYKFNPNPKKLILNYLTAIIIFIILIYVIRFLLGNIVK